jgi:DNA-directed RNA polymerase subunit RPC12/RpoP
VSLRSEDVHEDADSDSTGGLDGGPDPEEMLLDESPRVDFPCDNCGARMRWDPDEDALLCDHCGHARPVPRAEGTILERPLEAAGDAARGLGLDVRVLQCSNCGARVALDDHGTTGACVYCGSSQVLAQEANRNALRPESLVPMDVGEGAVREGFHRWLKRLWFRPDALKKTKGFDAVGIYVPFWTFDCSVESHWSADAGYYYWVTETYTTMVNGKPRVATRQVRKVRWEPARGQRRDTHDDVLVAASAGIPAGLVAELGRFDTGALVPYRPEYLAGWRAEEYQTDLAQGWALGQELIGDVQRGRCSGDVPGDTQRALRVENRFSEIAWKHVLLPVWSLAYTYRGKGYRVLVHGQTGRVVGEAPYSWVKIALAVLGAGALVAGVAAVSGVLSG